MSQAKPIPDGYHSIQPYLIFKNCGEAIAFYMRAFGAKERFRMPNAQGRVQHAEIQIGDSVLMMADEAPQMEAYSTEHFGGSPVSLLIYTEDCDGMYAQAVGAGARGVREPADQPYGDRMSGVKDPFGYSWYIATHIKDVSVEEMAAKA
ncbi:MAG TPA: VOC family protein [Bryobacteraceae bacterium]|nr:VOC family protein [Bryobacteraceae bacterium]